MVDIDRAPDWHDLLAQLIAGQYGRGERVDALTDATQGIDAAITANYLVDTDATRTARETRYADAMLGGYHPQDRAAMVPWWRDELAAVIAVADAEMAEVLTELVAKFARHAALGRAVEKAKGRGEVEVLIANLEADAHRTQHEETTC